VRCSPVYKQVTPITLALWHRRLGHLGCWDNLRKLVKDNMVTGINLKQGDFKQSMLDDICTPCVEAKHSRSPFPASSSVSTAALDLVHMDICGPYGEESLGGSKYVATFLDDFSKLSMVRPLSHKSDTIDAVKEVIELLETQSGLKVKRLGLIGVGSILSMN
jgi:hypothetical protein